MRDDKLDKTQGERTRWSPFGALAYTERCRNPYLKKRPGHWLPPGSGC